MVARSPSRVASSAEREHKVSSLGPPPHHCKQLRSWFAVAAESQGSQERRRCGMSRSGRRLVHLWNLTWRSTGRATAGELGLAPSTLCIFGRQAKPACRVPPVNSTLGTTEMSPAERASLEQMLRAFAPDHFERWSYLLTRKPERWSKITPMLAWGGPDPLKSYPNMPFRRASR
jgi:hypothetical protein